MRTIKKIKSGFAAAVLLTATGTTALVALPGTAMAQASGGKTVVLSAGKGQQVNLSSPITDVVVSNPNVADVEVRSSKQIYIFGKGNGETDVFATDAAGRTVYKATIRVGNNLDSLDQMMALAMPDSDIKVTTMNGVVLLTGTVAQPEDAAEAERLIKAFLGGGTEVVTRLKNSTPLQVNLQVRVAEVSRSLAKEITGNLQTSRQSSNGTTFIGGRGRDFITNTGQVVVPEGISTIAGIGRLFGVDIGAAFDMSERAGLVSTLANPNLTTISGETAEFLAGGRFPIVTSSNNGVSVTYEQYGVGLTYTPTVMADGRISLRVRSEVSDISSQGAVRVGGLEVPATTTRLAETTVELGSGESMMIAGLLSNQLGSSVDKTPGLGDIPILGSLFKSNGWRKNETELMIVITPYLVKPVSDSEIRLPTDGIHSPDDASRVLLGKVTDKKGDPSRPMPTVAPEKPSGPQFDTVSSAAPVETKQDKKVKTVAASAPTPGFSFGN